MLDVDCKRIAPKTIHCKNIMVVQDKAVPFTVRLVIQSGPHGTGSEIIPHRHYSIGIEPLIIFFNLLLTILDRKYQNRKELEAELN